MENDPILNPDNEAACLELIKQIEEQESLELKRMNNLLSQARGQELRSYQIQ